MQFLAIVAVSVAAAVTYGIIFDQFTIRLCLEYFTIGHPRVIRTEDPTLLALFWGVFATWWVGLGLGIPAGLVARLGRWPKLSAAQLAKPIAILMAVSAVGAAIACLVGYMAAQLGWVFLVGSIAEEVPRQAHHRFLAAMWAHIASYGIGFIGGIVILIWMLLKRQRLALKPADG